MEYPYSSYSSYPCQHWARELLADAVPCALNRVPDAGALGGAGRRSRVGALGSGVEFVDQVASTAAANVVDGSGVLTETLLLGEFLVEAEHGAFRFAVHVTGSTAAGGEESIGWRRSELDEGGRARGIGTRGHVLRVDASSIASAATAGIVVVGGGDGWVRLGDVVGKHLEFTGLLLWLVVGDGVELRSRRLQVANI